jgi:hypothetical protein
MVGNNWDGLLAGDHHPASKAAPSIPACLLTVRGVRPQQSTLVVLSLRLAPTSADVRRHSTVPLGSLGHILPNVSPSVNQ